MKFKQFKSFTIDMIKDSDESYGYMIPSSTQNDMLTGVVDFEIAKDNNLNIKPMNYITYRSFLAIKDWQKYKKQ